MLSSAMPGVVTEVLAAVASSMVSAVPLKALPSLCDLSPRVAGYAVAIAAAGVKGSAAGFADCTIGAAGVYGRRCGVEDVGLLGNIAIVARGVYYFELDGAGA